MDLRLEQPKSLIVQEVLLHAVGDALNESIADKIGGIIQGSGSTTVTYDDANDTITISSTGKTEEEIQDIVGAQLVTNGSHTNITASYDDSGDGAVDLSITDAAIRGKISVTDSGGDGSLAYDNGTGVITYTGLVHQKYRHISLLVLVFQSVQVQLVSVRQLELQTHLHSMV